MADPNPQRGELFMKAVIKSCLTALFGIGVKSSQYIDRFIILFSEAFEKNMVELGFEKETVPTAKTPPVETTLPPAPMEPLKTEPESGTPGKTGSPAHPIEVLGINLIAQRALEKAGFVSVEQLIDYIHEPKALQDIKGIGEKTAVEITEKVNAWKP